MRRKNLLAVIALAMTVMVAATACGSKNNTKQESSKEAAATVASSETGTGETKEESSGSDADTGSEDTQEDESEETTAYVQVTSADAGSITSGVFTSVSGKYQITPPAGWSVDEDGDETLASFTSPSGNDILEVTYVEGDDADGAREVYPATMEEYKKLVDRGDDMEFVRYNVKTESNGSQKFDYAVRYKNAQEGVRYFTINGSYDAAAKKYISAAGTIESDDKAVIEQVEAAVKSLKLK